MYLMEDHTKSSYRLPELKSEIQLKRQQTRQDRRQETEDTGQQQK